MATRINPRTLKESIFPFSNHNSATPYHRQKCLRRLVIHATLE